MNNEELQRAAVHTLRTGITQKNPPGEKRDHLLARLDIVLERAARVRG
jgi:hypothetical protein